MAMTKGGPSLENVDIEEKLNLEGQRCYLFLFLFKKKKDDIISVAKRLILKVTKYFCPVSLKASLSPHFYAKFVCNTLLKQSFTKALKSTLKFMNSNSVLNIAELNDKSFT